ncbi:MAG: NYN domain-containing protein [bacterium]|nr:NYN domain-containing protein [bacterium]
MKFRRENNLAFIDGQNLHLGTTQNGWKVDHNKLRIYLKDKYHVTEAYYFLGYISEEEQDLYNNLQKAGFIVVFKEHNSSLLAKKKGNVDTDIVFEIMKNLVDNKDFDKFLLVSGDGDYKKVVDYLIKKDRFKKILFPNKDFASSLYKTLGAGVFDYMEHFKTYVEWHKSEKGS